MAEEGFVELPFRAEYAKSARASCRSCKDKIEKDDLRLAVMVQAARYDGKQPNWYHFKCFFGKQRPKSVAEISHFESLRWDDQEKIRQKIGAAGPSSSGSGSKASKRKSTKGDAGGEFSVENSKSSRATCRGCGDKIIKGDIRVSKKDYESDEGRAYGGIPLWHHLDCFVKLRAELEYWPSGAKLPGLKAMTKEDQVKIKEALPEIKPVKKEEVGEEPEKKPKLDNKNLKKQNDMMYRYRDQLKGLTKKELVSLLEHNNQDLPEGTERMLDRLSDAMSFGALKRCSVCKRGQLVFRSGCGYFCLGNRDEWTKCESTFDDPPRTPFSVPAELAEKRDFLQRYKYKPEKRIFEKNCPSKDTVDAARFSLKSAKSEPGTSGPRVERHLPLRRMEFAIVGKLSKSKADLKLDVMKLGGTLGNKVHDMTTAVISTKETVKKEGISIKIAEELNIQVVPESFFDECKAGSDPIACINRLNLATWGSDPSTRLSAETSAVKSASRSVSSRFKSNAPTKVTLKIQNGLAVDPDSELQDVTHVYRDPKGNIYNAALSISDIQTARNSYYKLQILESDNKKYWLFRSWGRIGTTIGGVKTEPLQREEAIDQFKMLFNERTANSWDNRNNFVKVPGKMAMMDICYDDDHVDAGTSEFPSRLMKPVQDLIQLIFNVSMMKNVMKEMELDLEKMPLGKLSKSQIQDAFKLLTELQNCIQNSEEKVDTKTLIRYTNQFFTLIPHDFGIDNPPLLSDLEVVKQKTEMLDSLMEIEIAYSLLKESEESGANMNPIDANYMKLNAQISVLDKNATEFETIKLYLQNTHAETHRFYNLEILEVFKVNRHGEEKRFERFKNLHNRKLLWHGSRLTNYAGILSQGLRIAPPEAPVTGYMFGKGIYFADMVSKSANYCMASPANDTGLLLLCEVALGDLHELTYAENIVKPPKGKHSVKGIGRTYPDPSMAVLTEDGVEVPLGTSITSQRNDATLLYNEYIVYDIAQVKVQYLVQTKFNYRY